MCTHKSGRESKPGIRRGGGMMATLLATIMAIPAMAGTGAIDAVLADPGRLEADRARDARSKPRAVLEMLEVGPGDTVADIFAGAGYYSELLGALVSPGGKVLMHNNKAYLQFVGSGLEKRFGERDVPGVERHDREVADLGLGENSLDAAMIVMSYHDLYHVAEGWPKIDEGHFMGQIVAALKPGGRFLLVDHAADPGTGNQSSQELHRIEEAFVREDVTRFGLEYVGSSDALRNPDDDHSLQVFDKGIVGKTDRFILLFRKP